jgi:Secretion system C-terminal sorting domain/Domain of unknown function (DUF2341)/Fibronectin type III domain
MKKHLLIFQILTILFAFLIINTSVNAQLPNWSGSMNVVITNNSSTTMTDYQVPIVVNTQALISMGLMQTNGNDIRFGQNCIGSVLHEYWIEGYINTDSTKVWVKIPSVPGNNSVTIYMFFGNPAATEGSSLITFDGPFSSTDSVSSGNPGGVGNSQRGFRFTPNVNVLMTHYGKREPTGTTRYVTLFNFTTQAIVTQGQVSGPAGQYSYSPLTSPVWLMAGQQYVLELFQGTGDGYYFGTSSQINSHLTYGDMKYCNSCTQNTFPTSTLSNYQYGYPDFWFYVAATPVSPAPTFTLGAPADTNTPAAPTNLTGSAGNQTAFLQWHKNTEFDVVKYYIYRHTSNNPGSSTLIDSTSQPDTVYTATGLNNGTPYYFWVRAVDAFCAPRISGYSNFALVTPVIVAGNQQVPKEFALHQNYPNPFNPVTTIKYDLPKNAFVRITVFDVTGREVEVLVNEFKTAGYHELSFSAENLASGAYFYKIEAGEFVTQKKMVVIK